MTTVGKNIKNLTIKDLHFFLGGRDLEMLEIRKLLQLHRPGCFEDRELPWGGKASDYEDAIGKVLELGKIIVLIELPNDLTEDKLPPSCLVEIDHHGLRAGQEMPTALEQVFDLIGLDKTSHWTRRMELVAANDRGYIPAMKAVGATLEEIQYIRKLDRQCQGITEEQERQAINDISTGQDLSELIVVETRLESSSAIVDFMQPELGGSGFKNLLVLMKTKAAFYGSGTIVQHLANTHTESWYGGALPANGYWGSSFAHLPSAQKLIHEITTLIP